MTPMAAAEVLGDGEQAPAALPWRLAARAAPSLIRLLVLTSTVAAGLVLRRDAWLPNSDSVAQQSIVQTWFAIGHGTTYLPPDSWILKLPLFVVVEASPLTPAVRLFVEALVLALVTVVLAARACRILAGQAGLPPRRGLQWADVLPLCWLATLGGGIGNFLVTTPNTRNIELGLALLVIALAGRWLVGLDKWRPSHLNRAVAACAGAAVALALLWVDDPYGGYLVGLPLALAALAWHRRAAASGGRDRRLLVLAGVLALSFALVPVLRGLLRLAGVVTLPDAGAATLDFSTVLVHLRIVGPAVAMELGLHEPGAVAGLAHVLAVVVVAAGAAAASVVARQGWQRGSLALTFLGVNPLLVTAAVLVNGTVFEANAGRYLVLAFVDLAACLALAPGLLHRSPLRWGRRWGRSAWRVLATLLAAATLANLVSAGRDAPLDPRQQATERVEQRATLALLQQAAMVGASTGLAPFWTADLVTYRSSGQLHVSPVVCDGGRLRLRAWLTDSARLHTSSGRTFVLLPVTDDMAGCSPATVVAQLGEPLWRSTTPRGAVLLVYGRDVIPDVLPVMLPQ